MAPVVISPAMELDPGRGVTAQRELDGSARTSGSAIASGSATGGQPSTYSQPAGQSRHCTNRILTAEDDESLRVLMQCLLESDGYEVTACPDAFEAENAFARQPGFDLLVTDLEMPGRSGDTLAAALTARNPNLRVLIVSGAAVPDDRLRHFNQQGWNFLGKPFVVPDLLARVSVLMTGSQPLAEAAPGSRPVRSAPAPDTPETFASGTAAHL